MSELVFPLTGDNSTDFILALDRARRVPNLPDPVLINLAALTEARKAADSRIRLVLAYARTAVSPRPYRLVDLAQAAGLSPSGVRVAYRAEDIRTVADALTGSASHLLNNNDPELALLDSAGYLACGCHGSQREHTCIPSD